MSKVKSPAEKKRFSMLKDRRNVYGECPTSSRKNIRPGKQRGHMELRRAVNEELRGLRGITAQTDADEVESRAKDALSPLRDPRLKKFPMHRLEKLWHVNYANAPKEQKAANLGSGRSLKGF